MGAWARGAGGGGGAAEEGWPGGTVECLETSCSFDLLVSPVVASSACLTGLQLSSAESFSSGRPALAALQVLSSLALSAAPPLFAPLSSFLCLSGLSLSLFFSAFALSVLRSSLQVSSDLCLSSFSLLCFDLPSFPLSFFFFLPSSFLPSHLALSASSRSRLAFFSFRFSFFSFLSFSRFFCCAGFGGASWSWAWPEARSTVGGDCGLGATEGEEGQSALLFCEGSLWEPEEELGGLAVESADETEEEAPCFPTLTLEEGVPPRPSAEPFPFDSPFCFFVCTKPLCFLEVSPSVLVSAADGVWAEGVCDAAGSAAGVPGLGPAGTGWPLALASFSFLALSEEPLASVL